MSDPLLLRYEVIVVNGFLYRLDKVTGQTWRLEPDKDPRTRGTVTWTLISEPSISA